MKIYERLKHTDLMQQQLKSFHFTLKPKAVVQLFIGIGVTSLSIGAGLLISDGHLKSMSFEYPPSNDDILLIGPTVIEHRMESPLYFYYGLEGFFQNHRRYRDSVSRSQLTGADVEETSTCSGFDNDANDKPYYPCGLVARSVFTDTFIIDIKRKDADTWERIDLVPPAISKHDDARFVNAVPTGFDKDGKVFQDKLNMWLVAVFPPVSCILVVQQNHQNYKNLHVFNRKGITHCTKYETEHVSCIFNEVRVSLDHEGAETDPAGPPNPTSQCTGDSYRIRVNPRWGVRSHRFINWMDISGPPNFRKLDGIWDPTPEIGVKGSLNEGDQIRIVVFNDYKVHAFGARKSLHLTEIGAIGRRGKFLPIAYISLGVLCLAFSVFYYIAAIRTGKI